MKNPLFSGSLSAPLLGVFCWLSVAGIGWAAPGGAGQFIGGASANTGVGTGAAIGSAGPATGGMSGAVSAGQHLDGGLGMASSGGSFSRQTSGVVRGVSPGFSGGANVSGARSGGASGAGFRSVSPGVSSVGAPISVAGGATVGRVAYPGRSAGARPGISSSARVAPTNAWTDPRPVRTAPAARAGRYGYNGAYDAGQASLRNRLTPGQRLYQGSYNYPAVTDGRNDPNRPNDWRDHDGRSPRHYGHNHNPYRFGGFYYPYVYGGFFPGYYGGYYDNGVGTSLSVDSSGSTGVVEGTVPYDAPAESSRNDLQQRDDNGDDEEEGTALPPNPPARVGPENPAASEQRKPLANQPDSLVEAVQGELARRGYFPGKVDAIYGEPTREALRRFQADRRLAVTGRINEATLHALQLD